MRAGRRIDGHIRRLDDFQSRCSMEHKLATAGFMRVAGVDEAGRGALAGPVVAGAVVLGESISKMQGVNDSKQLSHDEREECYKLITGSALSWSASIVNSETIDRIGIAPANRLALEEAVASLDCGPDYVISDAFPIECGIPGLALIKGDAVSISVAAASIIAKVTRDRLMVEMNVEFPGYGFAVNKGYGTPDHLAAIASRGACNIHRFTFAPISYGDQLTLI